MKTIFGFLFILCVLSFISLVLAILKFANVIFIDWWLILLPVWGSIAAVIISFCVMLLLIYMLSWIDKIEIDKKNK
jgi:hypothetical protein